MESGEQDTKAPEPVLKSAVRATLIEFVKSIQDAVGIKMPDTDWEANVKGFFGVPEIELVSIETTFPLYQQSQACYAINKYLEKKSSVKKIVAYKGEMLSAPDYQEIEVKRGKTVPLIVRAWVFIEWKKTKFIIHIQFNNNYADFRIFGLKKNKKIMNRFSRAVKKWMRENNFFRGERLEFNPHGRLAFLEYNAKVDWDAVILSKKLKDEVMLNILFPLNNEKLCMKHNIPWRRGVLLAGIAGTGKTQLARVLLNMLGKEITVIWTTPKAIHNPETVKLLFDAARYFSPTLLVIEDIDFIGKSRDYQTDPIVGELLSQLDGSSPNHGVFTLATTNRPELLDKALLERPSRFDVKLIFKIPDGGERLKMVKHFSVGKQFEEVTHKTIANITNGFTGAYIKEVITYAMLFSLKEGRQAIRKGDLTRAISQIKEKIKPNKLVS